MLVTPEVLAARAAHLPEDVDPQETTEWLESLEALIRYQGPERAKFILSSLLGLAARAGAKLPFGVTTPYLNTIATEDQPVFPGNREMERKIKNVVRWNAMAMVQRANKTTNVGGHIATFASAATLYEIGWNHFFRGRTDDHPGDVVFYQGHASPGPYSRAFLEGRLTEAHLNNFRQELRDHPGLSSYPHPWLMPDFWQYPTVSMGLGPIMSIYHARFNRYLQGRGLTKTDDTRVWAFLGDGECDEPESLGCITMAAREKLDNLIWVINCNLQRLDGPVRGNGKIIQELEGLFRGAGWNVIKVVWGSDWDPLLKNDHTGALAHRMMQVVDGEYQEYIGKDMRTKEEEAAKVKLSEEEIDTRRGAFIREHFFNTPELKAIVSPLTDAQIAGLHRGGHDPLKVYTAYKAAVEHKGQPTVILAKTVKGYEIPGEGGEGKNTTHQKKTLTLDQVRGFRDRFQIPIPDDQLEACPFYKPADDSPEVKYLHARRAAVGGYNPSRNNKLVPCNPPERKSFEGLYQATVIARSTTKAWVDLMQQLVKDPAIGKLLVPIVPDEGQTFGMPPFYHQVGMYSSVGQLYTPVDKGTKSSYRESTSGQIFQEGINEAGAMADFIAAGTAYSTYSVNTIPFYIYYSMFGFQRIGDLVWAAADSRCRGFLMGATAGRTTINGEGLQHEDGHSHLAAMTVPTCRAYDPAFAYELAVIIEDGINAMYVRNEECFYYLTVYNESYDMPAMPGEHVREGIIKGLYPFKTVKPAGAKHEVQILGSGVIMNEALRAQQILAEKYNVASTVYSVTSYQMLRRDAIACERHNRFHPTEPALMPFVQSVLGQTTGPVIATSDYMRTVAETIAPFVTDDKGRSRLLALGTDGFGRSETRKNLRRFFEVDAENVTVAALYAIAERGGLDRAVVAQAIKDLGVDPTRPDPWTV
ncbi:pyruvate dehydrogenase (acetyl-transferring), homodimeric type [Fimbriiglobus ruber]|uniref:Pyruvate dehydrogenase E1 component n=1 Tax=Fimbriiglobus ruber TaxID=1908690 RepID=A0A225E689_9BACT|nr:pyruvate dehydrogenase (acetyl-transferring), homodimeric type [Fimbriiglobus ruber]OWK46328.1 Pyruvate dehydrogenase E1 component [Fimbriiglobus ruber]